MYKYNENIITCMRLLRIDSRKYGKEQEYFNINAINSKLRENKISFSNKKITQILRLLISANKIEALDKRVGVLNVYRLKRWKRKKPNGQKKKYLN